MTAANAAVSLLHLEALLRGAITLPLMENFWPEIAAADARWLDRHHGLGLIRFAIITVGQPGSIRFILWRGAFRHNPAQIDKGL